MLSHQQADIFDRAKRHAIYQMICERSDVPIFFKLITEDLIERLDIVTRRFEHGLLVNPVDPTLAGRLAETGCKIESVSLNDAAFEEDRPFLDPTQFDLVIIPWGLESINDLPGALALFRRAMKPDSLFLASFPGAGSFARLRSVIREAELEETGQMSARFHPQIDVRAVGDLLQRTGFALPVIDTDQHSIRYRSLRQAMVDLNDHGWGNLLVEHAASLDKNTLRLAEHKYLNEYQGQDSLNLITLTAWSAGENQTKPAARGSGQVSLASTLKRVPSPRQ